MANADMTQLLAPSQNQQSQSNKPAVQTKSSSGGHQRMASPYFLIPLGVVVFIIGLSTSMYDIQATEALAGGSQITNFVPNWQMLAQIPQILGIGGGSLSAATAASYYSGWIVEFASLILIVCFDLAIEAIWHAPAWAVEAFKYGMYFIAAVDIITNYAYEPGTNAWWVRLIIAVLIALSSFFFPIIGVLLVEKGFKNR